MNNEIIFYSTPEGEIKIEVILNEDDLWMSQKLLSELFEVERSVVTKHLRNIFAEGELDKYAVCAKIAHTASDGKTYNSMHYNLDAIIAVGYRVSSYKATQFRIWATKTLKEFISKGFVLDDVRLKQGTQFGNDYFDDLLERIREIRASERRFYQKITDIYSLAADYDSQSPVTNTFFASVQNKLHWAITGKTAAELIYESADCTKSQMGLTSWRHAPEGKIVKSDVSIAKNYLNETQLQELNRIVSAYLDLAENRAEKQILMTMDDWVDFLNKFLELSEYDILDGAGTVTATKARIKAEEEFNSFRKRQDAEYLSDFDKEVKGFLETPDSSNG
jgi:hypothetical protein